MPLITLDPSAIPVELRQRLAKAFGRHLGLPGNATTADVHADLMRYVRHIVHTNEDAEQKEALPPPAPFDAT